MRFSLSCSVDDDLYEDFRKTFPDLDIAKMSLADINGSNLIKEKWRNFIMPYEHKIALYNFGTLLRLDAARPYSEDNTYFGKKIQDIRLVSNISFLL